MRKFRVQRALSGFDLMGPEAPVVLNRTLRVNYGSENRDRRVQGGGF